MGSWVLFALGSAFFAGLTAFLGKMGVANVNSNLATFIRTVVVLLMTVLFICWQRQWQWPQGASLKAWVFLGLSGIATGLSWLCYYRALDLGPLAKVASVDKLSVAFAVLLGALFLGEKLTWGVVLGACLVTAGAAIMVFL